MPFGAQAYDKNGKLLGMIDNQSLLLVFGIEDHGSVDVRWANGSCTVAYGLPQRNNALTYERIVRRCAQPVARTP
ncbi:hypothetical protein WL30_00265 [Burkholderia ubonensis]|uniref:FimD/PapC C-terminal domain-containing protein n=1 Tax=Burkholderia ubonensis TaxID=101571 RepID=UPI000753ABCE|nr:FimD/PapC C-terminal domain-containing protein [Burkholderia ubonensis]KVO13415.1 hypothetical protein WJ74_13400 [Burkholderia ubonensis]KVU54034.1 hypothetical protein WK69_02165 [Burkholderia ubonensis]KWA76379.1 hypothetical protein WL30_00265 [Burkholderia ubonensis]KWB28117.1 hypothetical protein WL31_30205 [Burkholderia ubonensis]KWD08349.1 hypothetical protein WL59_05845 [Burkholderia ubonensis]